MEQGGAWSKEGHGARRDMEQGGAWSIEHGGGGKRYGGGEETSSILTPPSLLAMQQGPLKDLSFMKAI